jgi:hypothetical protein
MATKQKGPKKPAVDDRKLKQWAKRGEALAKSKDGNQWAIADWMCRGEDNFNRIAYKEAAAVTGMAIETLRTFASVAKNISTRVNDLSFGHHRLVVTFEPEKQKKALQWAAEQEMSVHRFAAWLRKEKEKAERRKHNESAKVDPNYHGDLAATAVIKRISPLLAPEASFYRDVDDRLFLEMEMTTAKRNELLEKIRQTEDRLVRWAKVLESKADAAVAASA